MCRRRPAAPFQGLFEHIRSGRNSTLRAPRRSRVPTAATTNQREVIIRRATRNGDFMLYSNCGNRISLQRIGQVIEANAEPVRLIDEPHIVALLSTNLAGGAQAHVSGLQVIFHK
jgi:hypothetical protein